MEGIKNTMDVLGAAEAVLDAVLKATEDGKISIMDVRHALAPAKAAVEAWRDKEKVVAELKDVDEAELAAFVAKGEAIVVKAMAALEALTKVWPAA